MASSRTTFEKAQRARKKKAKADIKRAKRQGRLDDIDIPEGPSFSMGADDVRVEDGETSTVALPDRDLTPAELMALVEQTHKDYESGKISFDEFELRKLELMEKLSAD